MKPSPAMHWLIWGKTIGGRKLNEPDQRLCWGRALQLYPTGLAWFSHETPKKRSIKSVRFAGFAILNKDFFKIEEKEIKIIESKLTIVNANIVYAIGEFSKHTPPSIPILPDRSQAQIHNGYFPGITNLVPAKSRQSKASRSKFADAKLKADTLKFRHQCIASCTRHGPNHEMARLSNIPLNNYTVLWEVFGCSCFAF